jgi:hypothetical protein
MSHGLEAGDNSVPQPASVPDNMKCSGHLAPKCFQPSTPGGQRFDEPETA